MSKEIKIQLTEDEKLELEYHNYQYQGVRILVEQFLNTAREYNEEHYNRLIDTYCEKYTNLQKCIYSFLDKQGLKSVPISDFTYFVNKQELVIKLG
jgi:hypothetical protein